MKENSKIPLLAKIISSIWVVSVIGWPVLYTQNLISHRREDRTAVAHAFPKTLGNILCSTREFVAFDRDRDGTIDEIKEYWRGMTGGRSLIALPGTSRYYSGNPSFEYILTNYFIHPTLDERREKKEQEKRKPDTNSFWFKLTHPYQKKYEAREKL
ncbi:MAG: hypothetical protein AABY00_03855 [Nanoarchaeota archaeon]